MEKDLIRLVYRSKSCIAHDDVAEFDAIFKVSRRNNKLNGITGALALRDGKFVQSIEGEKSKVGRRRNGRFVGVPTVAYGSTADSAARVENGRRTLCRDMLVPDRARFAVT